MPNRYTTEPLERGFSGTAKTIEIMHRLTALGKLDPSLQKFAYWIRAGTPQDARGSGKAMADSVFAWTRQHGIFTRDPFQIEKISHPLAAMRPVIELRRAGKYRGPGLFTGDCAHYAVFVATLGGILGFQYAFETAKVDAQRPDEFSHVWAALLVGGQWYPMDSSTPGVGPGWRPAVAPANFKRWGEKPIEEVVGMAGLGNGNGNGNGNGFRRPETVQGVEQAGYVDPQEYGYGIPKTVEPDRPALVPLALSDEFEMLVPQQPALSRGDLEDTSPHTRKVPIPPPDARVGDYAAIEYGRPHYVDKRPYISDEKSYPPDSHWQGPYKQIEYEPPKPYTYFERPQRIPVERRVEIIQGTPLVIHRQERPAPEGAMIGQAEKDISTAITSLEEPVPAAQAPAVAASKSVWDTIIGAFKAVATPVASVLGAKYGSAVSTATARVTGTQIDPGAYKPPAPAGPWYTSTWAILGGLLVVGGIAYVATRGGGVAVRRRRRNPYHMAVRHRRVA